MQLPTLQQEIHDWHRRNYPNDSIEDALLGIGEELGELMRAELKQSGGIRGTYEHWQNEKVKEAGDVFIGLMHFASVVGVVIDFDDPNSPSCDYLDPKSLLLRFASSYGRIAKLVDTVYGRIAKLVDANTESHRQYQPLAHVTQNTQIQRNLNCAATYLSAYCSVNGLSPLNVILLRWDTIRQRDFIANPETGGREREG